MSRASKKPLVETAAEYLAAKSQRELERLLDRREARLKPRQGRRLRASNLWQEWEIKFLGKIPDKEVARRTGRKIEAVGIKRRNLGRNYYKLPNVSPGRKWSKEDLALLGTAMDSVIAKKLNCTTEAIKYQRDKKGVPAFRQLHFWTKAEDKIVMGYSCKEAVWRLNLPQHAIESRRRSLRAGNVGIPARKWPAQETALLGKYTDTQLARKLGRSRGTVTWKRRALHIHAKGDYSRRWTPEEERRLGTMPDAQLAPVLKRGIKSLQMRRLKLRILFNSPKWTPAEKKLLGRYSDKEVARRIGRSVASVSARRSLLKIPSPTRPVRRWTSEEVQLLGTMSDKEVARRLDRNFEMVAYKRRSLRIPSSIKPRRRWTAKEDHLLGTMPDAEVAKHLKRSVKGVLKRRLRSGISFRFPKVETLRLPASQAKKVPSYLRQRRRK